MIPAPEDSKPSRAPAPSPSWRPNLSRNMAGRSLRGGLLRPSLLEDFNIDVNERSRGGGEAGDAARLGRHIGGRALAIPAFNLQKLVCRSLYACRSRTSRTGLPAEPPQHGRIGKCAPTRTGPPASSAAMGERDSAKKVHIAFWLVLEPLPSACQKETRIPGRRER